MKWLSCLALLPVFLNSGCDQKSSAATVSNVTGDPLPKQVTFNAHIRPIFSNTCFACHGFDAKKREADLRLDTPEGAFAKLKDSEERAIVPGKPDQSAILKRIVSTDPDEVMPPKDFHKDLTDQQKRLIRAWIEQGAKYEQHWAFTPVVKSPVPILATHQNAVANPIDAFVLASLENEKIEPSPPADKATLLRRLSLDLTGLPPDPAELDAFLADSAADAYEKQVDRLLASSHYGERMAVPWLDVVRFSDTVGYHGDQNVRVFPYRDYVIKAFNDNMPFDRFTTEQLAGDLLPNPTDEQRIATGFLRLNLMTREGGAQPKEYLAKSMGDRVRAVGAAWLGLTTGCAECHDHKFDPFTTRDFYSLGAFFADVRQWGVYADYAYTPNPALRGANNDWPFPPEIYSRIPSVEKRLAALRTSGVEVLSSLKAERDEPAIQLWSEQSATFLAAHPTGWAELAPSEITAAKGTPHEVLPDQSVVFTGPPQKDEIITLNFPLPNQSIRSIRLEVLPDEKNLGKVGRRENGKFAVAPTFAIASQPLKIAWSQADRRTPLKYNNGDNSPLLEPEWQSAPAIWEEPRNAATLPHQAFYHLAETSPSAEGRVLQVTLTSADIGRVRISITPFGDAVVGEENALRSELAAALKSAARSESDHRELAAAWMQGTMPDAALPDAYRKLRESIIACRGGYAYSVVAQAVPADQIPATHILPRGAWMNPADEVRPAVPGFLPHISVRNDGARLSRLDLAKWLTDKENPLTARQFSNRLWKQFFGKGLSNVLDDFGNQGEWPSHPQLLDWLAAEFRDSGWDVKHMVRLIVTSRTYQQVSATRRDLAEKDPANRLLAEQSARRLDAEFVRDNALSISGLLRDGVIGGPSVKPYQPAGYWVNLNFPERDYQASTGNDQYRRGLYMHWQRTFMHPMLAGFDAPSREECTADRFQSNSPQQALTLLNDPSFVEAARGFALRLTHENPGNDQDRIRLAVKLALAREAKPGELKSLAEFLTNQRAFYQTKPDDAKAFLKIGLSDSGTGQDPAELAAWAQLCRVILNLHETITRY
ncbi:MAG: PSD1 and planctomycete cytochrome C domain-containing protein [Luteolibacter sp.]|uniref:PSD1 and planctomycete cytochrome C domain-containing protein n=1 Tax=Luteolibacter sp. TaxID=1962973 RepID=UPI003263229A